MQCPGCNASLPKSARYCYRCGLRQSRDEPATRATSSATQDQGSLAAATRQQQEAPGTVPLTSELPETIEAAAAPAPSEGPYIAQGWSKVHTTPASPVSSGGYPPPFPPPPVLMSPPPAPGGWGRGLLISGLVTTLLLGLICSSVFVIVTLSVERNFSSQLTSQSNADLLYSQITSQPPLLTDSLQNPKTSRWPPLKKPLYSCELRKDGLHIRVKDLNRFGYCTSGHGKFSNFALQIDMQTLSGGGGGLIFRANTGAGNFYGIFIYPSGNYQVFIEQHHKLSRIIQRGYSSAFLKGPGQKNTLTVIAQHSYLYFYMNQRYLAGLPDSSYADGYLGVAAHDDGAPTEVVYTNVRIWGL